VANNSFNMTTNRVKILNIAAYKFVALTGKRPIQLKKELNALSKKSNLKGTILLSKEGINLFLAGPKKDIEIFWQCFLYHREFSGLTYKTSLSDRQPFKRMRVKIKDELIPMDATLQPKQSNGTHLSPQELKRWLDEGRNITLLDTRNRFEVDFGTFKKARHLDIKSFRSFPDAAGKLDPELKEKPLVMFCTGGIRCEKATPLLQQQGFKQVYQLEGGILKYFEACGESHFEGECFVFDERISLNSQLAETGTAQCARCFKPVTVEEQQSPEFVPGVSCPDCAEK